MFEITSGKIKSAQKVVIYGSEGIGKSTFASQFSDALFIDTEGSTKELDVRRLPKPTSWKMLKQQVNYVKANRLCKTLVIDTIDWAEQLCLEHICAAHDKKGIEDFGYGNGYVYEKEEIGRFLNLLEELIAHNINVVLTAHAQLRKFEQPDEMGAYDRWELKLGKKTASQISPLIKEWADMVLFANYKTFAVQADDKGKKFKAQGGTRVMYTQHHPCWDAKNRHGLKEELPFEYKEIEHIFSDVPAVVEETKESVTPGVMEVETTASAEVTPVVNLDNINKPADVPGVTTDFPAYIPQNLADLMSANGVTEDDIRLAVSSKGYFPYSASIENYGADFINGVLVGAWPQVYEMIKTNKQSNPFA